MSKALAPINQGLTDQQRLEAYRNTYCPPNASDAEFAMLVEVARRLGLDVMAKHVILRPAKQKVTRPNGRVEWVEKHEPVVTIDGFRAHAESTGEYLGQDPIEWCGSDGVWRDVWLADTPPVAARCTVHREGKRPCTRVAKWRAYVPEYQGAPSPTGWWKKDGAHMVGKCAEALALRAAFPNTLGGVYSSDEMRQAGPVSPATARTEPVEASEPTEPEAQGEWEEPTPEADVMAQIRALTAEIGADQMGQIAKTLPDFPPAKQRNLEHYEQLLDAVREWQAKRDAEHTIGGDETPWDMANGPEQGGLEGMKEEHR